MFYVYVLKSLLNGKRYVGSTGKVPEERLLEHNSGSNKFTRHNRPWCLKYTEVMSTKSDALRREKFLKTGKGREFLDTIILR